MNDRYYGKYRGKVTDNQDPLMLGRITASVSDVTGDASTGWAMPCVPFAGNNMGMFAIPDVGAGVWIEFEHGDPDYPIWTGCFWGSLAELPPKLLAPPYKKVLLRTAGGHAITLDDTPGAGGIIIEAAGGAKVKLTATGIELDNGLGASITLTGRSVSLNSGALEVT